MAAFPSHLLMGSWGHNVTCLLGMNEEQLSPDVRLSSPRCLRSPPPPASASQLHPCLAPCWKIGGGSHI